MSELSKYNSELDARLHQASQVVHHLEQKVREESSEQVERLRQQQARRSNEEESRRMLHFQKTSYKTLQKNNLEEDNLQKANLETKDMAHSETLWALSVPGRIYWARGASQASATSQA